MNATTCTWSNHTQSCFSYPWLYWINDDYTYLMWTTRKKMPHANYMNLSIDLPITKLNSTAQTKSHEAKQYWQQEVLIYIRHLNGPRTNKALCCLAKCCLTTIKGRYTFMLQQYHLDYVNCVNKEIFSIFYNAALSDNINIVLIINAMSAQFIFKFW